MSQVLLSPEVLIPDLLAKHPRARGVLDKYGLKGCGGENGPYETLRFFARAHDIDEKMLLAELGAAVKTLEPAAEKVTQEALEDSIYRRFFLAAIFVVLTFGATWGAILLYQIGIDHSFQSVSKDQINAHAQAQVYGWMGLFIMGFACQAFPRFWRTNLWRPKLAAANLILMLSGIVLSTAGTTGGSSTMWAAAAIAGTLLELIAVTLFSIQIHMTRRSSKRKIEPYILFVYSGLFWFVLSTSFDLARQIVAVFGLNSYDQEFLKTLLQPALRDMQFHGLALCMILGVCLRTLPHFYDAPRPSGTVSRAVLVLINLAVASEVVLGLFFSVTENEFLDQAIVLSHLTLLVASLLFICSFRLWSEFPETDRSSKFIRTAYLWLVLSMIMLSAMPFLPLSSSADSHAYLGSVRHAFTVGFVSLMIMGHAAKVVPTLNGIDPAKLSRLMLPFLLVNLGCLLRVVAQALTVIAPTSYSLIGLSGTMEVTGICIWSFHIVRVIVQGKTAQLHKSTSTPPERITDDMKVADVLDWFPQTEAVFIASGFEMIKQPAMRNTIARTVTLRRACNMFEIDAKQFVSNLNEAIAETSEIPLKPAL